MKKNFDKVIDNLKSTITSYDYFVNFDKVFKSVSNVAYHLNVLNHLIGKENFEEEFERMIKLNPGVIEVLPILLAIRDNQLDILNDKIVISYDFKQAMPVEYYIDFIYKTRLIELFQDSGIKNFVDYVTGVEVGLDTNGRKNRSGTAMEKLIEKYLMTIPNISVINQANQEKIQNELGFFIPEEYFTYTGNKRFDFAVKDSNNHLYVIEANFYRTSGSKLNETSRSYIRLDQNLRNIPNVTFIWITDGYGWRKTKNDLQVAYQNIENVYTISDLEEGIFKEIFNK